MSEYSFLLKTEETLRLTLRIVGQREGKQLQMLTSQLYMELTKGQQIF